MSKLLEIYNLMNSGELTEEQVAKALNLDLKYLRLRLSRWGHKLPLLFATLDKIRDDKISREEAAEVLSISTRQVNKLQESWSIQRPVKTYLVDKASVQIKWEISKKYAVDFIAGSMTIEESAESAGLSTRQMRRWVSDLLLKHYEMVHKELVSLPLHRRKRLADEIEEAENLEISKQQVLKSISDGKLSIQDEALNRVLSRRVMHNRRRPHAQ